MTLAELDALDFPALWAERQAAIGIAAVAEQFASLVAADDGTDDGTETTAADRNTALGMASEAYGGIPDATEQAFPDVAWWGP